LGHYYLIRLLIPIMLKTKGKSRVVQVSSSAHKSAPNPFVNFVDDMIKRKDGPHKDTYGAWSNYGVSKSCNVLCPRHVNTLYKQEENGIYGVSLHPGVIPTELSKHMPSAQRWALKNLGKPFLKTIPQGAATTVQCVCLSDEQLNGGGQYYADCNQHDNQLRQDLRLQTSGNDESLDAKLWKLSEELITAKGFSMTLEEESKQNDVVVEEKKVEVEIKSNENEQKEVINEKIESGNENVDNENSAKDVENDEENDEENE